MYIIKGCCQGVHAAIIVGKQEDNRARSELRIAIDPFLFCHIPYHTTPTDVPEDMISLPST